MYHYKNLYIYLLWVLIFFSPQIDQKLEENKGRATKRGYWREEQKEMESGRKEDMET